MRGGRRSSEPLIIVLDENIASQDLCDALAPIAKQSRARVVLHTVYFERGTADVEWMPRAAAERWAVISCDASMRRRPAEKDILESAGMCIYVLRSAGLNGEQLCSALVKALPAICRKHRQLAPPIICGISREGVVTVQKGQRRGDIKR